jgi:hypothetical protein
MANDVSAKAPDIHRLTLRINEDDYQRLQYWAARRGISANDYMIEALYAQIRRENGDYDIPTAEVARLNQLVDLVTELSSNIKSLENVTISGFDSLLGLTRGDNYLLEQEDGDI